jgi:hypothetical protein
MERVEEECDSLRTGAVLGWKGEGSWPTKGQNNKSAYKEGARMADSLQTYINNGFVSAHIISLSTLLHYTLFNASV